MPVSETPAEYHAYMLRAIAGSMDLPPLLHISRQTIVRAVYRVTMYYHDSRARNSVATVIRSGSREAVLNLAYQGAFHHKPIVHPLSLTRYEAFMLELQKLRFDMMKDQFPLPAYGTDLWLVERAASTFSKSVIVAPALAQGDHQALINVIKTCLPESLREVS